MNNRLDNLSAFHLQTTTAISPNVISDVGQAYVVDQTNFSALGNITCYTLEIWEDCMRVPHWHPNAAELGYVVSGEIEIIIWRSPGETAMFTLKKGMCWFIPQGALHSLNNIGKNRAQLLVGFSAGIPLDMDLAVAYNGIPVPIRNAYTSPHKDLRHWQGTTKNLLVSPYASPKILHDVITGSPYGFDLEKVTPLFNDNKLGSVIWGVQSNWPILEDISVLRAHLKPHVARDAIWYPDVGTLYVVSQGVGQFHIVMANYQLMPLDVKLFDYIYVPAGVLHTFLNNSDSDFTVTAFFTKANPQPEVSLSVATAFFPNELRKAAMTRFGNEKKSGDPLAHLNYHTVSPYLLPIKE